ncbi:MAG: hypothetical protein PUB52_00905 [Lachnospiraceae bacterium]|nr:hypothetical protein [Lachnospiraceae bacterium]MDD6504795.1 hypothetical protein [Lachnospiraceae bacterium]
MKKNWITLLIVGMMIVTLIACGKTDKTETNVPNAETTQAVTVPETQEAPSETEEAIAETEEAIAETQGTKETEEAGDADDTVYEDNFSVDKEAVVAFAEKIKEAVANQDIEALVDLASYPLYAGFEDGGVTVASREELIGFGTEKIFTPEMMDSIKNADENSLSPSMAGFALYSNDGPNMVFGVVNGKLAIQGINY